MFNIGYLKTRLGQYGALWVAAFMLTGAAIGVGVFFDDLIFIIDKVLPVGLGLAALGLGVGVVVSLMSKETLGTKLVIVMLAVVLAMPLLWGPVSAAVVAAFLADRSIEYSQVYAAFQIRISEILYPVTQAVFGTTFQTVWTLFQGAATVVGFFSALSTLWPRIRRLLGPEPVREA